MNIISKVLGNELREHNVSPKEMHALNLAFLGDAIHSLYVRYALVNNADYKQKELQGITSSIVCAKNQAKAFDMILPNLTEDELSVAKRARNAKTNNIAKNSSIEEYKKSTAYEALIGYLYLIGDTNKMNEFLLLASKCAGKGDSIC